MLDNVTNAIERASCHARDGVVYGALPKEECERLAKAAIEAMPKLNEMEAIIQKFKQAYDMFIWDDESGYFLNNIRADIENMEVANKRPTVEKQDG